METPDTYFRADIRTDADVPTVIARGEIDAASSQELTRILTEAAPASGHKLLDLSMVTFIDSSGLRVITGAARDADENGGTFAISSASDFVRRIFEVTGLSTLLPAAQA